MMQAMGLLAGLGPNGERDYGYLFIAFKPDLLGPADAFEREVTALIDRVKAVPKQPGVDEIRIPSERAFRTRERLLREGLEIDRLVFDSLAALRSRRGIATRHPERCHPGLYARDPSISSLRRSRMDGSR